MVSDCGGNKFTSQITTEGFAIKVNSEVWPDYYKFQFLVCLTRIFHELGALICKASELKM